MNTAPKTPSHPPTRILVVDDEEIVLVALRDTLRLVGYEVVTAHDGIQALERLQHEEFAVILTDHQMPTLTGLEWLAQAKELQPDAVRILISAVLGVNTFIDAINKAEIYRFILKPWQREELLTTLRQAVQRHETTIRHQRRLAATTELNDKLNQLNRSLIEELDQLKAAPSM